MPRPYFKPFRGEKFNTTKLLILSYSAYSWRDSHGKLHKPQRKHPENSLGWFFEDLRTQPQRHQRYFTGMSRALCGCESFADDKEAKRAWDECAYTIYIQRTVGLGARSRPTSEQFKNAGPNFLALIEEIRPLRVIVTGKTMWNKMPRTSAHRGNLEAYRLSDGTFVWCLAVPHPSNSTEGFKWKKVSKSIRRFRSTKLPLRASRHHPFRLAPALCGDTTHRLR